MTKSEMKGPFGNISVFWILLLLHFSTKHNLDVEISNVIKQPSLQGIASY